METIFKKLNEIKCDKHTWNNWSLEELKKLLEIYLLISKKEGYLFDLIYQNHGCDSYEHIFRDYNDTYLEEKMYGVEEALENINDLIQKDNEIKEKNTLEK